MQFIIFQFANNTIVDLSTDFSSNRHFAYDGRFVYYVCLPNAEVNIDAIITYNPNITLKAMFSLHLSEPAPCI